MLDWNPRYVYRRYFNSVAQIDRFLAEVNFNSWNLQQDMGRPFAEGIAELSRQYPQYAALIRAYYENWEQSIAGPIPGMVDLARLLKASGLSVYVLSNCSAETFPIARDRFEFLQMFDGVVISGDVGLAKPDRRIFEFMLETIGQKAAQCLLIDDAAENTAAAEKMGFRTILFRSADDLRDRLRAMGLLGAEWRAA